MTRVPVNHLLVPNLSVLRCLSSAGGAGELMDNIGGYVNPLRLLQRMPEGMAIHNLRDRLVHIIADFRTQTSLREGCNTILHTDCLLLAQVRYAAHIWFLLHSSLLSSSRLLCLPGMCPLLQQCSAIVSGVTPCRVRNAVLSLSRQRTLAFENACWCSLHSSNLLN